MGVLLAEFVGTFALVFAGVGAIALGADLLGVALAHGLAITLFVTALGHVSGGHFNPAVTLGFWVTGRIAPGPAVQYWVAQLAGAVMAMAVLSVTHGSDRLGRVAYGAPQLAEGVSPWAGVVLEAVLTFFLMWVIMGTAVDPRAPKVGGFAIGLTITMDILAGGPLTGAAMNPARALGPELWGGVWRDAWVYLLGPAVGAAAAAWVYDRLYLKGSGA